VQPSEQTRLSLISFGWKRRIGSPLSQYNGNVRWHQFVNRAEVDELEALFAAPAVSRTKTKTKKPPS
jgi:hypothetical protein